MSHFPFRVRRPVTHTRPLCLVRRTRVFLRIFGRMIRRRKIKKETHVEPFGLMHTRDIRWPPYLSRLEPLIMFSVIGWWPRDEPDIRPQNNTSKSKRQRGRRRGGDHGIISTASDATNSLTFSNPTHWVERGSSNPNPTKNTMEMNWPSV